MSEKSFFTIGGTIRPGQGVYIRRKADDDLVNLCQQGHFAYILTARQMGKSSLVVPTIQRLRDEGVNAINVDLTQFGTQVTAEAWYLGLLIEIARRLRLPTNVFSWWKEKTHLGVTQRLVLFFREIVLEEVSGRVAIFIDEIDTTLSLTFTDDFFAAIRYLYNERASVPEFERISFVLIGVATPSDLMTDPKRTPFNIGQRVDLTDFTVEEALPLADGLNLPKKHAQQVIRWMLHWTGGHPYLTQRLCQVVANDTRPKYSKRDIKELVTRTFLGDMSEQDENLRFVHDMLTRRAPNPEMVIGSYRSVRMGWSRVPDEEQSIVKSHLKLSGVVRREKRMLAVRNRIYEEVFDWQWIRENQPRMWIDTIPPRAKMGAWMGVLITLVVIVVLAVTTILALRGQRQALDVVRQMEQILAIEEIYLGDQVARSPDGQLVASIDGDAVILQDDGVSRPGTALPLPSTQLVTSLAFSPNSQWLSIGYADGRLLVWDVGLEQVLFESGEVHDGRVITSVAFAPAGTFLASGGADSRVILWEIANDGSLQISQTLTTDSSNAIALLTFTADSQTLAATLRGEDQVIMWDLTQLSLLP